MRERELDGKLQVIAAMSLFRLSGLIYWDAVSTHFTAVSHSSFDSSWPKVDPVFGRLVCWINVSTGAEFLLKGVCLRRNVEIRKPKGERTDFGTLGDLCQDGPQKSALTRLFKTVHAAEKEQQTILKGYQRLRSEIRNRDVHAYVPNVRDEHFDMVPDQLVPCLNLLISWLPGDQQEISKWCDEAPEFIASL